MAQRVLSCGVFARDDSLNVPRLSKLYFLSRMMNGDRIELGSFLARQLYSATTSTTRRTIIGCLTTTTARSLGVEPNPKDQVSGSERLDKAAFE